VKRREAYDEDDFKSQPRTIRDHPFPAHVLQANRIHERGEEPCRTASELENCYAFRALGKGEEFD
jgi:hypothetical protein